MDLIKTILGFRLSFPSWVNLNLNRAIINEELDIGIHLVEQTVPGTFNVIFNVGVTIGQC